MRSRHQFFRPGDEILVSVQPDSCCDDSSHTRGHGMLNPLAGMKAELPIIDADTLEKRHYALQDANYSLMCIVDTNGDAAERSTYMPYGVRTILDGSFGSRSAFSYDWNMGHQGLMHDTNTSLVYNRHRMLHVGLGRFVQRDPLLYVDGISLYQYGQSGPIGNLDPNGTNALECIGAILWCVGGSIGAYAACSSGILTAACIGALMAGPAAGCISAAGACAPYIKDPKPVPYEDKCFQYGYLVP